MTPCRTEGFFEEVPTGDIEVLVDSRHAERFSLDEETTLFRRPVVRTRPRPREPVTIVRPVPESLIRKVRERTRPSGDLVAKATSGIRRSVILPWPMAVMVVAVLGVVTFQHARRGDTRGALLYTLSSTRSAMTALTHPPVLSTARASEKAKRSLRAAAVTTPEYLTITFASPEPKATPKTATKVEPKITPKPAAKPVAKTGPDAAAKADALVRAQLE